MPDDRPPFRRSGDVLLISPPFAAVNRPSLGLSLLQQVASEEGLACDIYYATLHLARALGEEIYQAVAERHNLDLMGERLFSRYAFPDVQFEADIYTRQEIGESSWYRHRLSSAPEVRFLELEATVGVWLEAFRQLVRQLDFRVFGLSTMFAQNLCCVSLARIIKQEKPKSLVLIGGANCDGEMARGIAMLSSDFDYIFIGEAEATFHTFCQNLKNDALPPQRLIPGPPTNDLDVLSCPDYQDYFAQLSFFLPDSRLLAENRIVLPYETSRGCWWGQKHHCTFWFEPRRHGLSCQGWRQSSGGPQTTTAALRSSTNRHDGQYHADAVLNTLLPAIIKERVDLDIFYEEKSNLNYRQLHMLKAAGVNSIQPGIEALSTPLLQRMRKGVSGAQNIRLLRDCRSLGISTSWNLLFNFPGDTDVDYEETLSIIGKLRHLSPPMGFVPVYFDRFSPYFREPDTFGIRNLRPLDQYSLVYPDHLAPEDFAYHFVGDADVVGERNPALVNRVSGEVQASIAGWQARKPILSVSRFPSGEYTVYDTRREGNPCVDVIAPTMAALITNEATVGSEDVEQAMARDWMVHVDGLYIGLAVASPTDIAELRSIGR